MEEFIVTRGAKNPSVALKNFTIVNYEAPKKKQKSSEIKSSSSLKIIDNSVEEKDDMDPRRKQELEMKRARFEVMKFGMSGLKKTKAKEAKIALAISLGARPPKNRRRNYKEILKEKEIEKIKESKRKTKTYSGVNDSLKKRKTRRKVKKDSGILGVYGTVRKE
ncbi:uncharacterized protein C1orf131 homolog [Leptopilina heterotoma]|uniref:uncharacterized protein C1orf131 homolog n=1 Tax=Leptopilina heterotoma TaxID=63436 RepID=UPI001CAA0EAC|nr:uncharacterized protein C1orf131 homolog [Leptopilina heterotoma]